MVDHPLFECALERVLQFEEEDRKQWFARNMTDLSQVDRRSISHSPPSNMNSVNVTLEVKTYKQHSDMIREVKQGYERLQRENISLRERLNKLKA